MGSADSLQCADVWHGGLAYLQKQSPCAPGFDDPLVPKFYLGMTTGKLCLLNA